MRKTKPENPDFEWAQQAFNGVLHTDKIKLFYRPNDKIIGYTLRFGKKKFTMATKLADEKMILQISDMLIHHAKGTLMDFALSKLKPLKPTKRKGKR